METIRYLPLATFLIAYFFLTVLMNLAFVFDGRLASASIAAFSLAKFPYHTAGYWLLLFLPFLVAPPVALVARRLLRGPAEAVGRWTAEFSLFDYLVITGFCYAVVIAGMDRAGAWDLLQSATDARSAVIARFDLLNELRFYERFALQSLLIFLSLYSLVMALRSECVTWILLFVSNLVLTTSLLFLLNMKWPVVVFFGGITASTMLFGRHRILATLAAGAAMVCMYLMVATVVLRIPDHASPSSGRFDTGKSSEADGSLENALKKAKGTVKAAKDASPMLAVSGLIRMALPFPYYYRTFTERGSVCGTIVDRLARRANPCQPSLLVYEEMFQNDGFAGRGTAPAAVHITGYALSGWAGALTELILASIVIGGFMALPIGNNAVCGTAFVMGILGAYFFSQLPFEGPFVYDHGMLWWALLVLGYAAFCSVRRLGRQSYAPQI